MDNHGYCAIAERKICDYIDQGSRGVVIHTAQLGLCDYRRALQLQYALHARCQQSGGNLNMLLLTEHFPVITLGYRRMPEHILLPPLELQKRGIAVVETERGGGATYHGPGQVVAYPIFSSLLRRIGVRKFVAGLEDVLCRVSLQCGVAATRREGLPGAWVGQRKLGAVGVAIRRGVSLHGCALNVNVDLQPFSFISPCGLRDIEVTSLQQEAGAAVSVSQVTSYLQAEVAAVFTAVLKEMPNEWCRLKRETSTRPLDYY